VYALKPIKVYMLEGADKDPRARARMERILNAVNYPLADVVTFNKDNLAEVTREVADQWPPDNVPEGTYMEWMRPLVFTTTQMTKFRPDLTALAEEAGEGVHAGMMLEFLGYMDLWRPYHQRKDDWEKNYVCWPTWDFGTISGCSHGCIYCGTGRGAKYIALGLNLEQYVEEAVEPKILKESWQRCFRLIGTGADHPTFEPEYGAFEVYLNKLAEHDRYGYFHSNSDNMDWVEGLTNRDRLIGIWSISGAGQARVFEPAAPTVEARIKAMGKLAEWDVPVRPKFKPILPVKGWREDAADAIKLMFETLEPESLGFCVYMWNSFASMSATLDINEMDPEIIERTREAADEMEGIITGPFPHDVRKEIYTHYATEARKYSDDTLLFISTESRDMWDDMAETLGQDPKYFFCGCSSTALPGRKLGLSKDCPHSTYAPHGFDPNEE